MTDRYEVEVLLRPIVEFWPTVAACAIAIFTLQAPEQLLMTPSIAVITASILGVIAFVRGRQALTVFRYQRNIKRNPRYQLSAKKIPVSKKALFLGRGFRWTQKHTERLYAARDKNAEKYTQPNGLKRFIREKELEWENATGLQYLGKLTAIDSPLNPVRPPPKTGGEAALHGVGIESEQDVYMPLSDRPGHTAVIAKTRHGTTLSMLDVSFWTCE